MKAACWALDQDVSVVIANGFQKDVVRQIINGKKVGTFFTNTQTTGVSPEEQASFGRFSVQSLFYTNTSQSLT